MPYPERPKTTAVVLVIREDHIERIRDWIRQTILYSEDSVPVQEFLFEAYQKLGQR